MANELPSTENIIAGIQVSSEILPQTEMLSSVEHAGRARELLCLAASDGGSSELAHIQTLLDTATENGHRIADKMLTAERSLAAYIGELTAGQATTEPVQPSGPPQKERRKVQDHPRIDFMRRQGFSLYTDVNDKLLQHLAVTPIPQIIKPRLKGEIDSGQKVLLTNPAGMSLCFTARQLASLLPNMGTADFDEQFDISQNDRNGAEFYTFANAGFSDKGFPWHFAAGVANAVTDFFVDEGFITKEQKDAFTLHDWANIIGSGWFSKLIRSTAFTSNGQYGGFGYKINDYNKFAFTQKMVNQRLVIPAGKTFYYKEQSEDGYMYATAELSPELTINLRKSMHATGQNIGCPVARYTLLLPEDAMQDQHVQSLIARGVLTITPERSKNGFIHLTQEVSAIDKTLALFAMQLDRYDQAYGTPRGIAINKKSYRVSFLHEKRPAVDALRWPDPIAPTTD